MRRACARRDSSEMYRLLSIEVDDPETAVATESRPESVLLHVCQHFPDDAALLNSALEAGKSMPNVIFNEHVASVLNPIVFCLLEGKETAARVLASNETYLEYIKRTRRDNCVISSLLDMHECFGKSNNLTDLVDEYFQRTSSVPSS